MEVTSVYKYARISSQKAREITREITGMPVSQALSILNFTPKKAAVLVGKTLRSAIANAENNHSLDADDLFIKSAVSNPGPTLHRIMPRARGSAGAIRKRQAHITVILSTREEEKPAAPKKEEAAAAAKPTKKAAAKKTAKKAAKKAE